MSEPGLTDDGATTGVLGGRWRATVTPWGAVVPWPHQLGDDEPALDWHIAADDRWHTPQHEAAVRQTRVEGTAVVETRVRIPNGDAVQRVYSVPEHGGLTIIEIENASPLAIAVAFTRGDLLSVRQPTAPIEGIELPAGSVAFPLGHHATLTVALPHDRRGAGALPQRLPPAAGVVRGWLATVERAGRLLLPDPVLNERVVADRCELALGGPAHPDDDAVAFLLGVGQLVRMGERADPWMPDVAHAVELAAKRGPKDWAFAAALDAAAVVFATAGDEVAQRDLAAVRRRVPAGGPLPSAAPSEPARWLAWTELRLVQASVSGAVLLPLGLPSDWAGSNFEVYGLPTGAASSVSFAVRWHGARPAVLWEQSGGNVALCSPELAPDWSSAEVKGEALWPEPKGMHFPAPPVEGESFS
ncbi:MAG: hypothetical protein RJA49_1884 [Actinomycetota bacterium]